MLLLSLLLLLLLLLRRRRHQEGGRGRRRQGLFGGQLAEVTGRRQWGDSEGKEANSGFEVMAPQHPNHGKNALPCLAEAPSEEPTICELGVPVQDLSNGFVVLRQVLRGDDIRPPHIRRQHPILPKPMAELVRRHEDLAKRARATHLHLALPDPNHRGHGLRNADIVHAARLQQRAQQRPGLLLLRCL